jgi:nitroimidazol reductase NimA-like FMN-containing flavoprotein (pyridoxamine 5'-phosphate oxidase superfamily)
MSLAMTRSEREAFLAALHVGVLSLAEEGRGPLSVPIWYAYEPGGELRMVTERDSRKGRPLARVRRASLCVQGETPPYQYVSVEGPVVALEDADLERDVRPIARRYLGRELGDRYVEATGGSPARGGSMLVRVRPERWLSVDYRKQFA